MPGASVNSSSMPSSQALASSGISISTTSQDTLLVSTITLTLAISPLNSPAMILVPVCWV
ncbi:hypothetical protein D3C84_1026830 [compost metagenome]